MNLRQEELVKQRITPEVKAARDAGIADIKRRDLSSVARQPSATDHGLRTRFTQTSLVSPGTGATANEASQSNFAGMRFF